MDSTESSATSALQARDLNGHSLREILDTAFQTSADNVIPSTEERMGNLFAVFFPGF